MHKKIILLALLASCAQIQQKTPENITSDREIASDAQTCFLNINKILSGNSATNFTASPYDEEVFVGYFVDFGAEFLEQNLAKISMDKNSSAGLKSIVKKVEAMPEQDRSVATILSKLNPEEKKSLWNSFYGKPAAEVEEEILKNESKSGDEIATFLLSVPQGEMRANANEAIALLKSNEPELSRQAIIDRVSGRMSACLIK